MIGRAKLLFLQISVAVVFIALWHLGTTTNLVGDAKVMKFFFSTPVDVFNRTVKVFVEGTIWKHLSITLQETVLAFVIGSTAGIIIGFTSTTFYNTTLTP